MSKHPNEFKKIPNKACVVITVKGDEVFNKNSILIAEKVKQDKQECVEARKEGRSWILQLFPAHIK